MVLVIGIFELFIFSMIILSQRLSLLTF